MISSIDPRERKSEGRVHVKNVILTMIVKICESFEQKIQWFICMRGF